MMNAVINAYLSLLSSNPGGGGMMRESVVIWDSFLSHQSNSGITGDMMEVGVYMGFGAAMFSSYLSPQELAHLVDIEDYREKSLRNIKSVAGDDIDSKLRFLIGDSMKLRFSMDAAIRPCRFIHIDGEHSYDAVINDLACADSILLPNGLICVDDFFNSSCPSVTQAVFDYTRASNYSLSLILIGYNKAYLCRSKFIGFYRKLIIDFPYRFDDYGIPVQLCASGFAHEKPYMGISSRVSDHRFQVIGRFVEDQDTFVSSLNSFW